MLLPDTASGQIAIRHNIKGINFCIVSACASSAHCIGESWEIIRRGDADVVVCGGSDATINPLALAGFNNARALSRNNEEPEKASRPFDINRDGFVPSEGAAILVIESLDHAKARGANILAEIVGYGATCDAYHVTAPPPDGSGAARAMKIALRKAGLKPEDIDYINAHGTSTPAGDLAETNAIKAIFGEYAYKIPVSSTKSELGHLLGASGAMEAIIAVETIRTGIIPPTINLEHPDPECDLDYVPNTARKMPVDVVLSNSFGFGGHNAALIFRRYVE
jgi:3-oxoacyl-[acyl-carrier-protein] synthase II